jgi:dCMP deaminase
MSLIKKISTIVSENSSKILWDEYFMSTALLVSCRSSCSRLHVGCVLVKNNRIISAGYNGFLPGAPHESIIVDNHEVATVHAEQNAVTDCANRGVSTNGATAYITHFPCINCTKVLAASGIKSIHYLNDYKNDSNVLLLLKNTNIDIFKMYL